MGADAAVAAMGAGADAAAVADAADAATDGADAAVAGGATDATGAAGAGNSLAAESPGVGGVTAQPQASAATASAAAPRSSDRVDGRGMEAVIDKVAATVRQASRRLPGMPPMVAGSRALSVHPVVARVTEFTRCSGPEQGACSHRSRRDRRSRVVASTTETSGH